MRKRVTRGGSAAGPLFFRSEGSLNEQLWEKS
jgi:hypothetical protein